MKIVAVGDVFITSEIMKEEIGKYKNLFTEVKYFFFGSKNRSTMRDVVKFIEMGGRNQCELPEGIIEEIEDADVLMVHLCPVTAELISKAKKLKYILCNRGGVENVDVEAATEHHIMVLNNPAHNANAVAEYTIGLMLNEMRNISRSYFALKNHEWREKYPNSARIRELKDLTIGIVGFGNVGQLVCEKLRGFECNILVSNLYKPDMDNEKINWEKVKYVDLEELILNSDIITLHARGGIGKIIFGKHEFEMMKPTAYFINTSRAYMVDYHALYNALNEQKIKGAAIDVFETEPIPEEYELLQLDNVTLTNHRGGDTINAYDESPKMMLEQFENYIINGERPKFLANYFA